MDCFNYPLDSKMLLRKKIRIKKELLDSNMSFIEKRIAVLGGSTTNEIVDQLELFLLNYGIKPTFYQSEYAQYWQDAMFGNEELDSFKPDIVYVHTNWRNITEFPTTSSTKEEADVMLKNTYNHFAVMWDKLSERFQCPIIQDNFDRPAWRLLGNSDVSDYRGRTNFISRLNQKLYQYADEHKAFFVNDVDFLAASRAEGEPISFLVGCDSFRGATAFAGVPGCVHGQVYELSDILWCVIAVDSKAAKLLFDLADLNGFSRVGSIKEVDGRCDFLDHRPPSFSALPRNVFEGFHYLSLVLFRYGHRASTAIMVRPIKWPFGARFGSPVCS